MAHGEHRRAANRVEVLGCPLDSVTIDEAVDRCEQAIESRSYLQHMSINAAKLVALRDDPAMREMITPCGLITADGQSVVWAARVLGAKLPERVAGIDLMTRMLEAANAKGYGVYVLGARPDVLDNALERLRKRYPALKVAGSRDGYYADEEAAAVSEAIRNSEADILFVAMSSPRKEYFLGERGNSLGVPFTMGVGGSIDVIAGVTRRAPRLLQRAGLEWAYRLAQEPRRLARRYLTTNLRFAAMVLRALVTRRGSVAAYQAPGEPPAAAARKEPSGRPR